MRPIAVYDASKQKLMGVFRTSVICDKYVWPITHRSGTASGYCRTKSKTKLSVFDFPITFRFANDEQSKWLSDKWMVVKDKYYIQDSFKRVNRWLEKKNNIPEEVIIPHESKKQISAKVINELREEAKKDMSIADLAKKLGITAPSVKKYAGDIILERKLAIFTTEQLENELNRRKQKK